MMQRGTRNTTWTLPVLALLAGTFVCCAPALAQNGPATQRPATQGGAAPLFVNMVFQPLRAGRNGAYDSLLAKISRRYQRAHIPAYWVELEALTGPSTALSLNLFESFDEAEKTLAAIAASVASHPDLAAQQEQLLTNVTGNSSVLTVRRDGLGYRSATIDFSTMRILRVTTVFVRPGHEAEFAEVEKHLSAARQADNGGTPWVVYEVQAGGRTPAYVILTPLGSLPAVEADISGRLGLERAASDTADQALRDLTRSAFESVESNLYFVNPALSHMSDSFTAGDPAFWRTASKQRARK